MAAARRLTTPVYTAVAYPLHMLWVPLQLWCLNIVVGTVAGVAVGLADGTLVRTELTAVLCIGMHLYFARCFRRDRHIVAVWRARFDPRAPMSPASRPRMILMRRGLIGADP
ncbi:hypothetical protein Sp245p_31385 (plasmid) [Azospirillum baldaniorum]|uniref:Uncharacterized protein n=1 Tax=Azospirillum baldaniorum TaxID=1064539 RepID=A0A9P1K1P3_9PROT|nr:MULTISPECIES: hypothetical protein [Azospirillum]AWJ94361.1 hypothetical protein Sp245p_31385 [Azospirillum baldaniorum]MBK3799685.1 hypothetical protein [Azospirillum argentinense]TWA70411.1 hypothetical protein FBZ85_12330 [Azospirillum brasilense]CCD03888.1 protein of unknown function [Azospirillum baldaniorum]